MPRIGSTSSKTEKGSKGGHIKPSVIILAVLALVAVITGFVVAAVRAKAKTDHEELEFKRQKYVGRQKKLAAFGRSLRALNPMTWFRKKPKNAIQKYN